MLVGSVRAAALCAEAVEHRNADRAEEVPVGPAAGRLLVDQARYDEALAPIESALAAQRESRDDVECAGKGQRRRRF